MYRAGRSGTVANRTGRHLSVRPRLIDQLNADLRSAWRALKGSPGASAVAIVIIGLSIGPSVALFTFIDFYALRPLPVVHADRCVDLVEIDERGRRHSQWTREEIAEIAAATSVSFEGLYGSNFFELPMLEPTVRVVHGQAVSSSYFSLVGARFALGRPFGPEADWPASEGPVAVLSHSGWQRLLAADGGAVGQRIRLGGSWFTAIGVTVPGFRGVEPVTPEVWIPLAAHEAAFQGSGQTPRYDLAGLLRGGVTAERASGQGGGVVAGFERPLAAKGEPRRLLVEHRRSLLRSDERSALSFVGWLALGAFGLVLLIASSNLASIHLAKASARHQEIATRLALGASRPRLVRQLLTESLLLSGIGATLGSLIAVMGAETIQNRLFSLVAEAGLTLAPIEADGSVLVFAVFLALVTGLALGLLPALEATSQDLGSSAKRDSLALGGRIQSQRLGGLLVTVQVSSSLVLLFLASLLVRTAESASRLEAGYDFQRLIELQFRGSIESVVERLKADPRIAAVSVVANIPLAGSMRRHPMIANDATQVLHHNYVDEAYFDVLDVELLEGRHFRPEEVLNGARVAVISAATAQSLWPLQSPLGQTVEVVDPGGPSPGRYEVVGVAPDVVSGLFFRGPDPSAVYFPAAGSARAASILARSRVDTGVMVEALRGLCQQVDPEVLCTPRTLRELAAIQRFPFLAGSVVALALGSLAVVLTAIGLYGIVAFSVVQRVREIGVRMAVGAKPIDVLRTLVGRAAGNVLVGLVLGLPLCVALSNLAARFFGLDAFEPVTLLGIPLLLAAVAFIAALIPARRAMAVDPVVALRME